ncbi:hypothetical protein CLBEIC_32620 [Clostridium beijerinckii]|nr:hypothetical protein [Clostridium beijerinckii]OOM60683.1 hypothetical protein CLOBI_29710 [Clostridium beijerinckii]OOM68605.1 hypothetical protein CLBEIC_32620 [Clostridium beijerinckii]CUU46941.1 protein of unknown function [Clostridium beijerinckii]
MCLDKDEFCKKLIEILKKRTASNEIEWLAFADESNKNYHLENNIFSYNERDILEEYKDYKLKIDESLYCDIQYGKNLNKIIRVSIISIEKDQDNRVKILLCDREHKKSYQKICNSDLYPEIERLYKIIEFKNVKEFEILEKWMMIDTSTKD